MWYQSQNGDRGGPDGEDHTYKNVVARNWWIWVWTITCRMWKMPTRRKR